MKLGIMQPYFFPYLGHFALIAATDAWVVFDITQYTPKSWMSRNRVLHPSGGANYISVALSNSSIHIKTHEAKVLDLAQSRQSTLGKLSHYRKHAPYFAQVQALIEAAMADAGDDSLVSLNVRGLKAVCDYLELPFNYTVASQHAFTFPEQMGPGDWAPHISAQMGAGMYINPVGGRDIFNPRSFEERGVELRFLEFSPMTYPTRGFTFEPHLSIIDVLMWNDPEAVRDALRDNSRLVA
ncbi:WbqC family protein [Herbaspirillum sp.]|uniref:WbqC family protein n=1 Tax=Herbaspirillum sp. TaxID=1890675 RepID=UPI001B1A6998|nr:WbqC family protein [Herbaspirillum sp.]MBO9536356.1 WbqC family protein [Herbaspirillum sp.]